MTSPHILCIDIGSTHLKAALLDSRGRSTGSVRMASPLQGDAVHLSAILDAAARAGAQACGNDPPDAIAITGATRTSVFVNSDGLALAPVLKLDDACGAPYVNTLRAAMPDAKAAQSDVSGALAFHPIARLLYFIEQTIEQGQWQLHVLELKDALNMVLSGVMASDPVTHARQQLPGVDMAALLNRLGLQANALPTARPAPSILGPLQVDTTSPWHRFSGVPVIECGFDAWCATLGTGAVKAGTTYNVCGTTDVFGSFAARHPALQGVSDLSWASGLRHLGGPCATGLGTLAWFGQQFLGNADPAAVLACASAAKGEPPLCIPFVNGERMPYWQADLTASFIGVQRHHGVPEMARALLDGLLVFDGWLLKLLNPHAAQIFLSGGGANLPGWAGLKAAAFDSPVRVASPHTIDAGLIGAAMCGCAALGEFKDLAAAQDAMALQTSSVAPDPTQTRRLQAVSKRLLPRFPEYPVVKI